MSVPIRIVLVDDHALVRAGFRALIDSMSGLRAVGEANDGSEALQLIKSLRPDIVLMDIGMQRLNGLEATARVSREFPQVRVIILSMHPGEEYVIQALRAGAAGYLLKHAAVAELEQAIRTVFSGETYLSPAVSKHVAAYVQRAGGRLGPLEPLTPRQREILQLIAEGKSMQEIAELLGISIKTVETHRAQLMERLNIHEVAGLVRYAIQAGLVQMDG